MAGRVQAFEAGNGQEYHLGEVFPMQIRLLRPGLLACLFASATFTGLPQTQSSESSAASRSQSRDADAKALAAQRADMTWLTLVDSGQYGQSWKEAGAAFRSAVTQEKWTETIKRVREPLGKLVTRRLTSASYSTTLPGAPDGEYEVIIFETSFEHKQIGYETVITSVEKDNGAWRVVGYYIK
jgi:hypothetical protein